MEMLSFLFGAFCCSMLFKLTQRVAIAYSFRSMELKFLLGAMSLIQYKHHAIMILELTYAEAAEKDPSKLEECKKIVAKIHEKFDGFGDSWIESLIDKLPYKTEYTDWKTARVYVEQLIKKGDNIE